MREKYRHYLNTTTCSECGKELNSERGLRQHTAKVHGVNLPNRVCKHCNKKFYDERSDRITCENHRKYSRYKEKPENVDMSLDEWFSLTKNQRYHLLNIESERERIRENKNQRKEWVKKEFTDVAVCEACGIDESDIIEFHHTDKNELSDSPRKMAHDMRPKEEIQSEIEKGMFLCPNCHARKHRKT